ncbi:hypothetical protein [Nostoc sp. LPT]|uniref:hypothetical protein n=1 Tax=Nostoc sp. LPT TaxID=2815387 RepID=UPI001DC00676|nr:hypothetical protein [Nostoc sp. LPT]MBN4004575.1 hypothetical protein [Nostoc sp. LPT]
MKTIKSLATLTLCILSALSTSVVLNTQQVKAEKACSNRSLYGVYANQGGGYVNNTEPYVLNVLSTYDGNGKATGTILVRSIAGKVTTNLGTQGTYQVNSDCSFTASYRRTDGTTVNYSGVVYDDGDKFSLTETDSGTVVNIQAQRVRKYYPNH